MRILLLCCCLMMSQKIIAQLPVDTSFQLAVEKQTRTLEGNPGQKYWQNQATYEIKVDFNPANRLLKGKVDIQYVNHSPDTLRELWFKLFPNLYKKGVAVKSKIAKKDQGEGIVIDQCYLDRESFMASSSQVDGTNWRVGIPGLEPGKKTTISISYHYTLNEGSHNRTGQVDEGSYFIAYFFPRLAVYDDVDGWNKYPYTGQEEFYNDFCDFQVEITAPKGYTTWATGDLLNAKKVLDGETLNRLKKTEQLVDTVIDIITKEDLRRPVPLVQKGKQTFRYRANQVPDFAFAISNHYVWRAGSVVVDSSSYRRTRVDAVFNPVHRDYEEVIDFAMKTVRGMSFVFPAWPFPYAHMTVFDGLDQMEYPMMANDNPTANREDAITLTNHEIFHTMFPFYMGIHETKYGWMDEGWATIGEWKLSKWLDSTYTDDYGMAATARADEEANGVPIVTPTPNLTGSSSFLNSYPKPALGYLYVEECLGPELFQRALHHYIRTWHGKHPQPLDFFRSMNVGAGRNLDWFWRRWFYEKGGMDLAIDSVSRRNGTYQVLIKNKGTKPLPIHLIAIYKDGSTLQVKESISAWESGNAFYTVCLDATKKLSKLVLGDVYIPDQHPKDNVYLVE